MGKGFIDPATHRYRRMVERRRLESLRDEVQL
jgi:hypothetical protein